jgi:large subunit ribosomal protein L22
METAAKLKNSPLSPQKMRLLADMIRGMRADKALYTLKVQQRKAYALSLEKTLRSAIANWTALNPGQNVDESELYIKQVFIDGARMLKRVQPAPQGRAHRVRKRFNHITIIVDSLNAAK